MLRNYAFRKSLESLDKSVKKCYTKKNRGADKRSAERKAASTLGQCELSVPDADNAAGGSFRAESRRKREDGIMTFSEVPARVSLFFFCEAFLKGGKKRRAGGERLSHEITAMGSRVSA